MKVVLKSRADGAGVAIFAADTEQEADEYMDIVFALCAAYERQGYIEGIKVGMRLVIEMVEG